MITTTCRFAWVKLRESQIQILFGSHVIESGHTRVGGSFGMYSFGSESPCLRTIRRTVDGDTHTRWRYEPR